MSVRFGYLAERSPWGDGLVGVLGWRGIASSGRPRSNAPIVTASKPNNTPAA